MMSRLRKLCVLVVALFVLFTGMIGWSGGLAALTHFQHVQSRYHQLADDGPNRITCPPPPYMC